MIWTLHGALGSGADWSFLRRRKPGGEAVRCLNLWRMPGESLWDWAAQFCRRVRLEDDRPFLAGYSLGGRLALHALLADPGLWRAACIVSAHPGLSSDRARASRRRRDARWLRLLQTLPWPDFLDAWNRQEIFAGSPPAAPRRRARGMERAFGSWSLGAQEDLGPRLSSIPAPVRWLAGERDRRFVRAGRRAAAALPRGSFAILPGCGHRLLQEAPRRVAREMERLLESV